MTEDKVTLAKKRAELIQKLATPLLPEDRARLQGELSVVNAQIKALNTTEAARLKAAADRKRAAGLAEAQANTAKARANAGDAVAGSGDAVAGSGDAVAGSYNDDDDDDDPAQTKAIDAWIVTVLRRGGVKVHRASDGNLDILDAPAKWVAIVDALSVGIHAAARGEELPEVTAAPKEPKGRKR